MDDLRERGVAVNGEQLGEEAAAPPRGHRARRRVDIEVLVNRRGLRFAAGLLAFALVAACSGTDSGDSELPQSATNGAAVVAGGADPVVVDQVRVRRFDEVPATVAALTSARLDSGVSVTVDGGLGGSVVVSIPVSEPPSADVIPGVLHLHDDGTFTLIPALYDADAGTVTVTISSFSDLFGGWWNPLNWAEEAIQVVQGAYDFAADWVTGRTDPPACGDDPPDWASVATLELSSFHVCSQSNTRGDGTERVEIYIKSNRSTMQTVTIPAGIDYLWVETQPDWFRPVSGWIASDITPTNGWIVTTAQAVTLFGGESMSFGFTRPTVDTDVEVRSFMSELQIVANHALGLIGGLEGDAALAITLAAYACTSQISGIDLPSVSSPPDSLPEVVDVIAKCALELISEPELFAGIVREIVEQASLDGDQAADFVLSRIPDGVSELARALLRAINVAGAVTRVFDGIFDSVAEGQLSFELRGHRNQAPPAGRAAETGPDVSGSAVGLANAKLPDGTCGLVEQDTGTQLVDGIASYDDGTERMEIFIRGGEIVRGDVDGDGKVDEVGIVDCWGGGASAMAATAAVVALGTGGVLAAGYGELGFEQVSASGWAAEFDSVAVQDQQLVVHWLGNAGNDPKCCPTLQGSSVFTVVGEALKLQSVSLANS